MSRSKKDSKKNKGMQDFSLKRDIRKIENRGLRRHTKLEIKSGNFDLPDSPVSKKVKDVEQ